MKRYPAYKGKIYIEKKVDKKTGREYQECVFWAYAPRSDTEPEAKSDEADVQT